MRFSPPDAGKLLASASFDGAVRIWSLDTMKEQRIIAGAHTAHAVDVAWSNPKAVGSAGSSGLLLASGGFDRMVNVFDVALNATKLRYYMMFGLVQSVVFCEETLLYACDSKGFVSGFDARSSSLTPSIRIRSEVMVNCMCPLAGSSLLLCGDRSGSIRTFDVRTGQSLETILCCGAPITSLATNSPLETLIAVNSYDNTIRLFSAQEKTCLAQSSAGLVQNKHWPIRGAFSRSTVSGAGEERALYYASGSADHQAYVFRHVPGSGKMQHVVTLQGHEDKVFSADFHPTTRTSVLATASGDSTIRLWALGTWA